MGIVGNSYGCRDITCDVEGKMTFQNIANGKPAVNLFLADYSYWDPDHPWDLTHAYVIDIIKSFDGLSEKQFFHWENLTIKKAEVTNLKSNLKSIFG